MDERERNQWREADNWFQRLIELDESARMSALDSVDISANVRSKVDLLLTSSQRNHRLLDAGEATPAWSFSTVTDSTVDEDRLCGQRIGDWKLIEQIGSGGMSVVYRAERAGQDFTQHAAVKLLGMALRGVTEQARFRREQRILAQLQHPHIASLIDAGVSDDGTPYLAMSLVDGVRIDTFCDQRHSSLRARVELLLQVCAAVAYAHRQLVIHRDIKPGNILVDTSGHAMLLDFGIARLLDADSTGEATITRAFTPDYAAPEQRSGDRALGTPVDVYGLGAVLHRLLCGVPPQHDAYGDPLPASRIARERGNAEMADALRGDLDAILGKALANDAQHRYASVDSLAGDLQAWLRHRPLQARRATAWTRLRKFVRRNLAASALAALAMLAIAIGTITFVAGNRALERRALQLQAVTDFQSDMLMHVEASAVGTKLRQDLIAALKRQSLLGDEQLRAVQAKTDFTGIATAMLDRALLDRAVHTVRQRFADQPEVEATLLQTLATVYRKLFKFDAALAIQRQATALFLSTLGPGDRRSLASLREQTQLASDMSAPDARQLAEHSLVQHRRYLGEADIDSARALLMLGSITLATDAEGAEKMLRAALLRIDTAPGRQPADAAEAHGQLATALAEQDKFAAAESEYRQAIDAFTRTLGPNDANTLQLRNMLAWVRGRLGRPEQAHTEYAALYPLFLNSFGEYDPRTLNLLNNIAAWPRQHGDYAAAEAPQRKAYDGMLLALGPAHPVTVRMQINLAEIQLHQRQLDEARQLLQTALAQPRRSDSRYDVPRIQSLLGETEQAAGHLALAQRWFGKAWQSAADPAQPDMQRDIAARMTAIYAKTPRHSAEMSIWKARAQALAPSPKAPTSTPSTR